MIDQKQQKVIAEFFKDFHSWSASNIGMWIGAGFFIMFQLIFMWIPYQDMAEDNLSGLMLIFSVWGAFLYILPYVSYNVMGKQYRIYDKIKYFPVSLQQLRLFRLKKLAKFCSITFVVFLAGQLLFSYIGYHEIGIGSILYPVIGGFLIPFGVGALNCCLDK